MILEVTEVPIGQIRPSKNNPRKHPKKQLRQLKRSLKKFGWMLPVLIDRDGNIIAGHGIYQAALELGYASRYCQLKDRSVRLMA